MPILGPRLVLDLLSRVRKVVRLRVPGQEQGLSAVRVLRRVGFQAFELDPLGGGMGGPCFSLFREDPFFLAGAGGVFTPGELKEAAREGANWVTLPGPDRELMEVGATEGILPLVQVRTEEEVERGLEEGCPCLLLAPPLSLDREKMEALFPLFPGRGGGREGGPALAWEGPWDALPPEGAVVHVVTGGLFPQALLAEGRFREIELLGRAALEENGRARWKGGSCRPSP